MVKDANLSDKPSHLRSRRRRGRRQKRTKGARARRVFKTQRLRNGRKLLFQPLAPLTPGSRPQTEVGFRPHKAQSVPQHRAKSRAPRYGKCAGACSNRPTVEEFVLRDQPRGLRRPRQTLPEITHTHNNNNKTKTKQFLNSTRLNIAHGIPNSFWRQSNKHITTKRQDA